MSDLSRYIPTGNIVTWLASGVLVTANMLFFFGAQNQQSAYMMTSIITMGLYMMLTVFGGVNYLPLLGLGGTISIPNTPHVLVSLFGTLVMTVMSGVLVLLQNMYADQLSVRFAEGNKTGRAGEVTNKVRIYAVLSIVALLCVAAPLLFPQIPRVALWGTGALSAGMFVGLGIMLHRIQRTLANTTDG